MEQAIRSTSTLSVATQGQCNLEVTIEHSQHTSELTVPLEAKDPKRRGLPRKEQKNSGRNNVTDLPPRSPEECDSAGEGNWKTEGGRNESRKGNGKEKNIIANATCATP